MRADKQKNATIYTILKQIYSEPYFFVLLSREPHIVRVLNQRVASPGLVPKTRQLCWLSTRTDHWSQKLSSLFIFLTPTHFFPAPHLRNSSHEIRVTFPLSLFTAHPLFEIHTNWPVKGQYIIHFVYHIYSSISRICVDRLMIYCNKIIYAWNQFLKRRFSSRPSHYLQNNF